MRYRAQRLPSLAHVIKLSFCDLMDDQLAVLLEIRDEIRALRLAVESQNANGQPSPAALAKLLQEIHRASSGLPFSVADVTLSASLQAEDDEALFNAIIEATGSFSTRRLGHLLADIEGQNFGGLKCQRAGKRTHDGVPWRIVTSGSGKSSR
jgi:hypothetical protein